MINNPNKKKKHIVLDMELGDNPDNIILMYENPLLKFKNEEEKKNEEKDLQG